MSKQRSTMPPPPASATPPPTAAPISNRCISCGRLPAEEHCDICHRVARACSDPEPWSKIARSLALIADAIGYPKTAKEMREMVGDVNTEEANQ